MSTPRQTPRRHRRAILVVVVALVALALTASTRFIGSDEDGAGEAAAAGVATTRAGVRTPGLLVGSADAAARGRLAAQGVEPYRSAVDELVEQADDALREDPQPIDPLVIDGTDGPFVRDTGAAHTLAMAHAVTGDRRYADHAVDIIAAWVGTTRSTEETCPDSGSCQTSLVLGRTAPGFVFAVDLLRANGATSGLDIGAFHRWLASVILPNGSERSNNWGDAGTFMRFAVSLELGDERGIQTAVAEWMRRIDLVEPDGEIPEESRRGKSGLLYTQGALQYKVAVAWMAERVGIELWDYKGARGGSLRAGLDSVARYLAEPDAWPWHDGKVRVPSLSPMWELVAAHWPEPQFEALAEEGRPFGEDGKSAVSWTTLAVAVR